MKTVWMNTLGWVAVVLTALILAVVAPQESSVMGRLPALTAQRADRQPVAVPQGLGADRTLAIVTFSKDHRKDAESWINGLQLRDDPNISWVRMPVLNDPGNPAGRHVAETRLRARYTSSADDRKLLPVFTDRAAFAQSAGLPGTDQAYAMVVNRDGDVLARVAGEFDEAKAEALRETLLGESL